MSYFKKTIKIIIIVVYLEFASAQSIFDSVYDFGLRLDNLAFCNDYWYPKDFSGLKRKVNSEVFGQPFVKNILPIIEDYYLKPHSTDRNPILFSFHGPSGVGKSFIAEMLSLLPFIKNKFFFSSKSEFSDASLINKYKANLNKIIDSSIKDCERSIFVFDDADYIPSGMIDALNVFNNKKSDLKYGESWFIFIFQVGSEQISITTSQLMKKGMKRDQFSIQEFHDVIKKAAHDKGIYSNKIFLSPVNKVIPFLPLEKEHIRKFIETESGKEGYKPTKHDIEKMYAELEFQPGTSFSSTGCKLVKSKLQMVLGRKEL